MLWLADTSVAVPALQASHVAHAQVQRGIGGRALGLPAHAALETYSVLTRLPGDARLSADDASTLIADRFDPIIALATDAAAHLVRTLAERRISGGAVYDAVIGLTALRRFSPGIHAPRPRIRPLGWPTRSSDEPFGFSGAAGGGRRGRRRHRVPRARPERATIGRVCCS